MRVILLASLRMYQCWKGETRVQGSIYKSTLCEAGKKAVLHLSVALP